VLKALEHQLARVSRRDDRVNHSGLIPSRAVTDLKASPYDANLRSAPQMLMYEELARDVARRKPGRLLDWGCGWGQVTMLLRERGVDVTAFEVRDGLSAPTTEPLERYPEIVVHLSGEPVALPFDDGSFDTVLSCGVLEHVPDPSGSLSEIRRVLRPGGMFYVTNLPNRYSYTERIARLLGLYYHGRLPNDRVYTKGSVRGLLGRHGFEIQELRLVHMLPLTLGGPARPIWATSRALERIPGLNLVATSLELVAVSGRSARGCRGR
jgi:ubiquinone/menaquinone biosynthesis C-methylase UbiE